MNVRFVSILFLSLAISAAAAAQDANSAPPDNQGPAMGRGGRGQRGGGGAMGMMGRGIMGTVTEVGADHYTIKTFTGETYTIHYSVNTRFMKQGAGARGQNGGVGQGPGEESGQGSGQRQRAQGNGQGRGQGMGGGNPPQLIKSTDIKVGDAVAAMGELDTAGKSVGAMTVALLDSQRAQQMQQMEANYGKTWLMGKVTAINEASVTLLGSVDNAPHIFVADENTTFRERRNPITLADIKVGDTVRADGALKDGAFTATTVNIMNIQTDAPRAPRNAPPQ